MNTRVSIEQNLLAGAGVGTGDKMALDVPLKVTGQIFLGEPWQKRSNYRQERGSSGKCLKAMPTSIWEVLHLSC